MPYTFKFDKQAEEYYKLYEQYSEQYGENTVILYELGGFYEMFGLELENKPKRGNIKKVCEDVGLNCARANKNLKHSSSNPLKAGFPNSENVLNDWIKKFTNVNYTVVIYSQVDTDSGKKKRIFNKIKGKS